MFFAVTRYEQFRKKSMYKLSTIIIMLSLFTVGYIMYYTDSKSTQPYNIDWYQPITAKLAYEHQNRLEHMRNMCQYLQTRVARAKYKNIQKWQDIYTVNWNTTFCVIPKSGCSFQKQMIIYLNKPSSFITEKVSNVEYALQYVKQVQKEVFNISRAEVHSLFFHPISLSMKQFVHGDFTKIMTTRNPYSRLYSAYIDKVYIPVFQMYLEDTVHEIRQSKNQFGHINHSPCRTKYITFEEFLEAVLLQSSYGQGDKHWAPVTSLCQPCRVKPDIIVKQENYHDDMQYVLSRMKLNHIQRDTIQSVLGEHGIHSDKILLGLMKTMLSRGLQFMGTCFTKIEIVKRVWNSLKVQGQIYQYLTFPYSKLHDIENLSVPDIAEVFMSKMHTYQITTEESEQQRKRALARAYRNIRQDVIIQIQAMYYYDFKLFDYDLKPPI